MDLETRMQKPSLQLGSVAVIAVKWGATAKPMEAAVSQPASTWPYPQPPLDWRIDNLWAFFGTRTINGSHPPDSVPDPAITYGSQPYPSCIFLSRNRQSAWGDWDQARSLSVKS